jgi:hypothetical protein
MSWKGMSATGWLWLSLLGLFLFTAGPILVALTAGLVAAALGCQLDEGNIHACPLSGSISVACFISSACSAGSRS